MSEKLTNTNARSISFVGQLWFWTMQWLATQWKFRGLGRLVQLTNGFLGDETRIVLYGRRFRFLCNCSQDRDIMIMSGLVNRAADFALRKLISSRGEVTLIDVGAHEGFLALLSYTAANSVVEPIIHCFEPNPHAYARLKQNVELNGFPLHLMNQAVGAEQGQAEMTMGHKSSHSTLVSSETSGIGRVLVEVTTLDSYCKRQNIKPDIIKVDVEGFELDVLRGASCILRLNHPFLIVEANPRTLASAGHSVLDLLKLLKDFEYDLFYIDINQINLSHDDNRQTWQGYKPIFYTDDLDTLFDILAIPSTAIS